jgi:hypothetical protein
VKQALHIFRKDVRYLRWELGVALLLLAMFVCGQLYPQGLGYGQNAIMSYLLLAFWAFLCARLVQAEPIPGDRQFWITRPYQRSSLLRAKLFFIVACIAVPLTVADAVILGVKGFSVAAHLPGLTWSLLLITASALMVFCAFATLTRGLTDWMLGAIFTIGLLYTMDIIARQNFWGGVEWIREYGAAAIVFAAALVVLLGQYSRRRTRTYIVVMATGLLGSSIYAHYASSATALELETRFSKPKAAPSSIQIVFQKPPEPAAPRDQTFHPPRQEVVALAFPIDVLGLDEGEDLIGDEALIAIQGDSGETWSSARRDGSEVFQHVPDGYRLLILVGRSAIEKTKDRTVQISVKLYLTMLRDSATRVVSPGAGSVEVPGIGRCRDDLAPAQNWIMCESPLRPPSNFLAVQFAGRRDRFLDASSYSPFPADPDSLIVPVGKFFHSGSSDFAPDTLTSLEPVAHFRRDFTRSNVSRTDYHTLR